MSNPTAERKIGNIEFPTLRGLIDDLKGDEEETYSTMKFGINRDITSALNAGIRRSTIWMWIYNKYRELVEETNQINSPLFDRQRSGIRAYACLDTLYKFRII